MPERVTLRAKEAFQILYTAGYYKKSAPRLICQKEKCMEITKDERIFSRGRWVETDTMINDTRKSLKKR